MGFLKKLNIIKKFLNKPEGLGIVLSGVEACLRFCGFTQPMKEFITVEEYKNSVTACKEFKY